MDKAVDDMDAHLKRAFAAGEPLSSFCREAVVRYHALGRIDLMEAWMLRVVWTRDRDFRFLEKWLADANPGIAGAAVRVLGKSGEARWVGVFGGMLLQAHGLPFRLRLVDALGDLGGEGALAWLERRLAIRDYLPREEEAALYRAIGRTHAPGAGRVLRSGWDACTLRPEVARDAARVREIRQAIIAGLGDAPDAATVTFFAGLLGNSNSSEYWQNIIAAAGNIRTEAARMLVVAQSRPGLLPQQEARLLASAVTNGALLPLDILERALADRIGSPAQVLKALQAHPWADVRHIFLRLLNGAFRPDLESAAVIAAACGDNRETAAAPALGRRLVNDPDSEIAPLWIEALGVIGTRAEVAVLEDIGARGLPGMRILALQAVSNIMARTRAD